MVNLTNLYYRSWYALTCQYERSRLYSFSWLMSAKTTDNLTLMLGSKDRLLTVMLGSKDRLRIACIVFIFHCSFISIFILIYVHIHLHVQIHPHLWPDPSLYMSRSVLIDVQICIHLYSYPNLIWTIMH